MSHPTPKRIHYLNTLPFKTNHKTLLQLLKIKRIFNLKASSLILEALESWKHPLKISNRKLSKHLTKEVTNVVSRTKNLLTFVSSPQNHLKKLHIAKEGSRSFGGPEKTTSTSLKGKKIASALGASKHLQYLDIKDKQECGIYQSIRVLRDLRYLRLIMPIDLLIPCNKMCERLTSLKILNLELGRSVEPADPSKLRAFYKFFKNIASLNSLHTLKLDFTVSLVPQGGLQVFETVLSILGRLKLSVFFIEVQLYDCEEFDVDDTKEFLAQVEFLSFAKEYGNISQTLKAKNNKVLSFKFFKAPTLDITPMLQECKSLKSLAISTHILMNLDQDYKCPETLKDLAVDIEGTHEPEVLSDMLATLTYILDDVRLLESFELSIPALNEEILSELIELHELPCVKGIKDYFFDLSTYEQDIEDFVYEDFWGKIGSLKSLENLDIRMRTFNFPSKPHIKSIEKMLSCFPELRSLGLIILPFTVILGGEERVHLNIPFHNLLVLKSVSLSLSWPLAKKEREKLFNNVKNRKGFEKFELQNNCLWDVSKEDFERLTQGFSQMKSLKELNIETLGMNCGMMRCTMEDNEVVVKIR